MLEYPEMYTIANQMKKELIGKSLLRGTLVKPNNYLKKEAEANYSTLENGRIIDIDYYAPELYIMLDNGYGILFCEGGGKILYNKTEKSVPKAVHLRFDFSEGSCLTYSMLLWSLGVYSISHNEWRDRKKSIQAHKYQPVAEEMVFDDFVKCMDNVEKPKELDIKSFIIKQYAAGIMSTYAAEILWHAKVFPAAKISALGEEEKKRIFSSIAAVIKQACEAGGKSSEVDLYNNKGKYNVTMERKNIGSPCPVCKTIIGKVVVGGETAVCERCQPKK